MGFSATWDDPDSRNRLYEAIGNRVRRMDARLEGLFWCGVLFGVICVPVILLTRETVFAPTLGVVALAGLFVPLALRVMRPALRIIIVVQTVRSGVAGVVLPCRQCGYSLRGLRGVARCPECGEEIDR